MHIGVIGPIWLPIPPPGHGGSEIVVYNLVEGLVDRGHEVTLFASGGSKTRATLKAVLDRPLLEIKGKFDFSDPSYDLLNAAQAFSASGAFDVLHNAVGYQLLPFTPFAKCPVLHMSHSSLKEYEALVSHFQSANFVSISHAQRQFHVNANYVATVYHGIDTNRYIPAGPKEDFFVSLSEIWEPKGTHLAIEAIQQTSHHLVVAGFVDDRGKKYFTERVEPHIDGKQITYVGPADEQKKIDLFQRARALLFPTQWHEAFGLVIVEALACGTPVIAWNKGAAPELITPGETGYIVNSVEEMAAAIEKVDAISPQRCREEAEKRFSRPVMAKNYEKVYQRLLA